MQISVTRGHVAVEELPLQILSEASMHGNVDVKTMVMNDILENDTVQ